MFSRFSDLLTKFLLLGLTTVLVGVVWGREPSWAVQSQASGLSHPWAVAFLPDGSFLVTERTGLLRRIQSDGRMDAPINLQLPLAVSGQGGLLDLALDPDFAQNRRLYLCYAEKEGKSSGTALLSATLSPDFLQIKDTRVLFRQTPKVNSSIHFGCRIVLSRPHWLYLSLGERGSHMEQAQNLDNHLGKVIRLHTDGSVPKDNPFVGKPAAQPQIWSHGHRNPQGAALGLDGKLWLHEHGPQGGDEINLIVPGANYGWPVVSHGENYGGGKIGLGLSSLPGMEPPAHHWTPSIAPSGMAFLSSTRYGSELQGQMFVGSLKFACVVRMQWHGGRLHEVERIPIGERVRDVRQGPDGWLYVLTDSPRGQLLRLQRR